MLTTSASVRFTVWTNAMLTGACDPDTAAQKILGDDVGHHVAGLAGHPEPATLPVALNLLRAAGATQAHLALPVPGDPIGLAGPPPSTRPRSKPARPSYSRAPTSDWFRRTSGRRCNGP